VLIQLLFLPDVLLTAAAQHVIMMMSATPSAVMMVTMSNIFDLDAPPAGAVWVAAMLVFAVVVIPVLFFIFA
jgi:hypothetical protein